MQVQYDAIAGAMVLLKRGASSPSSAGACRGYCPRMPAERSAVEGKMIWFNPAKHFGFIRTDEGERLRVDETGLEPGNALGDRCRGTRVSFDRVGDEDEARAVNVSVVPLFAERRARWRSRR